MKKLLVLCTLACGGEAGDLFPADAGDLGTLEQRIYLPDYYGAEAVSGSPKCHHPWEGAQSMCRAPDNKDLVYKFYASTCNSWWQARFVDATNQFTSMLNGWNDEWNMQGPLQDPIGGGEVWNYRLECGTLSSNTYGVFGSDTNPANVDNHNVPGYGTFSQYRRGTLTVSPANIEARSDWAGKTNSQKILFANNMIKHELGHLMGHGHVPGCGEDLMNACPADGFSGWYTTSKTLSAVDNERQRCYNEDSGTTDDC